ncbi:phosphatidylcholine:diacylglycerol cholinephosphotransferase 1 [Lactuca sativa]|uniref:phosphatidylcholine:diacylglycerol cholinephosphotransferase 1 n=1 Tax=Lactuca sativa TaxID=4236 RepID=UPI000CB0082F|nr:phosphatidylcholine:diacylglycerol cholinephosphotransferase 1 [Lactuca sativa]XP_042756168.1 phosphatidylcholine:diacylglycerol cholinephosphotransferase 1 [Lactuca sativa]
MNGDTLNHRSSLHTNTTNLKDHTLAKSTLEKACTKSNASSLWLRRSWVDELRWRVGEMSFMKWTADDVSAVLKCHPIPCLLALFLLFFMRVEYTLPMIPPSSPPFDIGFVATVHLHRILSGSPVLNTILAGLNTVFVGMQTVYIIGTWVVEGRPRATIAALLMFTFRGILGYSTQLPLPQGFLGSGVDFPVGNVSFFLFYSGHVAASVIASLDMRRMQRSELAILFDIFNVLQFVRLLSTRGHYTIDLVVGIGAGMLFDSIAGKYIHKSHKTPTIDPNSNGDRKAFLASPKLGNGTQ